MTCCCGRLFSSVRSVQSRMGKTTRSCSSRLVALFNNWSDDRADEVFADNVTLDNSYERRRVDLSKELEDNTLLVERVDASNFAQATAQLRATDGRTYQLTVSLSAQNPPAI